MKFSQDLSRYCSPEEGAVYWMGSGEDHKESKQRSIKNVCYQFFLLIVTAAHTAPSSTQIPMSVSKEVSTFRSGFQNISC